METLKIEATFTADGVSAALDAAEQAGLLCETCTNKIATQREMSQSDFCFPCQEVVTAQLKLVLEGRLREELVRKGLPANAVRIDKQ